MDIDLLSILKNNLNNIDINACKALGQNFIFDTNITNKIVKFASPLANKTVIEIGPGPGILSYSIYNANPKKYILIEKDKRFADILSQTFTGEHVTILNEDALLIEEEKLLLPNEPVIIISNLPYNISTQLLFKWLPKTQIIEGMYLMFQKEVAERIIAKHNSKAYGKLSIMNQWLYEVKLLFNLHPNCFTPAPKIFSSVLEFKPRKNIYPAEFEKLSNLCNIIFHNRRKTLSNNLKNNLENYLDILSELNINPQLRAEQLDIESICKLSNYLKSKQGNI